VDLVGLWLPSLREDEGKFLLEGGAAGHPLQRQQVLHLPLNDGPEAVQFPLVEAHRIDLMQPRIVVAVEVVLCRLGSDELLELLAEHAAQGLEGDGLPDLLGL
jgi:hypothetical protein